MDHRVLLIEILLGILISTILLIGTRIIHIGLQPDLQRNQHPQLGPLINLLQQVGQQVDQLLHHLILVDQLQLHLIHQNQPQLLLTLVKQHQNRQLQAGLQVDPLRRVGIHPNQPLLVGLQVFLLQEVQHLHMNYFMGRNASGIIF